MFDRFKKRTPAGGPDISTIDSREKIDELHIRGKLERLLLLPKEFGAKISRKTSCLSPWELAQLRPTQIAVSLPRSRQAEP